MQVLLNRFSVLINYIVWSSNHFSTSSCFSGSRFFSVQVFQGPGLSGFKFLWVQVFAGPGFSGSRFFKVQVFQGPGLGFRSSPITLLQLLISLQFRINPFWVPIGCPRKGLRIFGSTRQLVFGKNTLFFIRTRKKLMRLNILII